MGAGDVAHTGTSVLDSSSLKAALDLDWDDPSAGDQALRLVLDDLTAVDTWVDSSPAGAAR